MAGTVGAAANYRSFLACRSQQRSLFNGNPALIDLRLKNLRAWRTGDTIANTATIRNANGLPATFAGSKTGQDDAPFVFVKVGDEERRMRWTEWDALPAWTGPRPPKNVKGQ